TRAAAHHKTPRRTPPLPSDKRPTAACSRPTTAPVGSSADDRFGFALLDGGAHYVQQRRRRKPDASRGPNLAFRGSLSDSFTKSFHCGNDQAHSEARFVAK